MGDLFVVGSTTLQRFTSNTGTTTSATSTDLYVSNLASTTNLRANSSSIGNLTSGALTISNLGGTGTRCVQTDNNGLLSVAGSACGAGGGGGASTWATTTSQTSQYVNYSLNDSDVIAIGSNSTTTSEFFFDPSALFAKIGGQLLTLGSTTLQNFTSTQGTTTNFAITSLSSQIPYASPNGAIVPLTIGTNLNLTNGTLNGTASFAWPFTKLATNEQATSTTLAFLNGFLAPASSTLSTFTFSSATGTSATTTSFAISSLSNTLLKANANGSIISATANTDYQSPISATFPVLFNSNVLSLGFGTTTANSWSGAQTFLNASTTLQNFTAQNATTTQSTSTNLAVSSLTSALVKADANGSLIEAIAGTDYQAAGSYALQATTITLNGTSNQITSSAGSQDLSTNRTWTLSIPSLFNIAQSSTTIFSTGNALFGLTATSSFNGVGDLFVVGSTTLQAFNAFKGTTISATSTNLYTNNFLALASTTLQNATTSDLFVSGLASTTNLRANSANFGTSIINNLTVTSCTGCGGGGTFAFPYTTQTDWGTNNATTTILGFKAGFYSLASSTIGNNTDTSGLTIFGGATTTGPSLHLGSTTLQAFTGVNATTTNATTTNFYVSNLASTTNLRANVANIGNITSGNLKIPSGRLTSGTAIDLSESTTAPVDFTGDMIYANIDRWNYSGSPISDSGSLLNLYRANTNIGVSSFTVTDALAKLSSQCNQLSGTCVDSSSILSLSQLSSVATGDVLVIANSGTGKDISGTSNTWSFSKAGLGTLTNLLVNASTTLQAFTGTNYLALSSTTLQNFTSTQGTTTNFAITSLSSQIPYASPDGSIVPLTIGANLSLTNGTLAASGGSSFAWPFTKLATNEQATSTTLVFGNGFISSASSTLSSFTADTATTTSATSTDLYVSNLASTTNLRANVANIGNLTVTSCTGCGGGSAAGLDTYVQFNDGGTAFGGDADFAFNKTTNLLTVTNASSTNLSVVGGVFDFTTTAATTTIKTNQAGAFVFATTTSGLALMKFDTTNNAERVTIGVPGSDILIGDSGNVAPNIAFVNNGAIKGNTGAQTITLGGGSDIINVAVKLGVGTTSPWRTLSVTGNVGFDGLTSTTTIGNSLCLSSSKEVTLRSGNNCATASSLRFKHDINPLSETQGLSEIMALRPVSFYYNTDYLGSFATDQNWSSEHLGFIAEEIAQIDSRLVTFDSLGQPDSVRYEIVSSLLTKAVQELNLRIENIASSTATTTPDSTNFANSFFNNMFARIGSWLASAANGIVDLFANKVHTNELCVRDNTGAETCITKAQLDALLSGQTATATNSSSAPSSSSGSTTVTDGGSTTPATDNTGSTTPITTDNTASSTPIITDTPSTSTTTPDTTTVPIDTTTTTASTDTSTTTTTPDTTPSIDVPIDNTTQTTDTPPPSTSETTPATDTTATPTNP